MRGHVPVFFDCATLLANPVGTLWCLGVKLDLGQQVYEWCGGRVSPGLNEEKRRCVANLGYRLDDFGEGVCEEVVNRLVKLSNQGSVTGKVYKEVDAASRGLTSIRVRNTRRSIWAILIYVGLATVALLSSTNSEGLDYALPHTIALRELCFFILAMVILSSAVGTWSNEQAACDIIHKFAAKMEMIERSLPGEKASGIWADLKSRGIRIWDGGSYLFRPQKSLSPTPQEDDCFQIRYMGFQHIRLLVFSFIIVLSAFAVSFTMSYVTPTRGIGARGLMEIIYLSVWVANFLIDQVLTLMFKGVEGRKKLFTITWIKDGLIATLALLFFFLPFIGKWTMTYFPCSS